MEKGQAMVEVVVSCILLVMILLASVEVFTVITTKMYMEKVVREAGREAVLAGNIVTGEVKGNDIANQYLGKHKYVVKCSPTQSQGEIVNVSCFITLDYPYFKSISANGMGGGVYYAEAIYPWKDET